ncbi:hypothetical protein, partial [Kaarinaea lacus]
MLAVVIWAWINNTRDNAERIQQIVNKHLETRLTADMLLAGHDRALNLYMMTTIDDPFEQDDAYLNFRLSGEKYLKAREKILAGNLNEADLAALARTDELAAFGGNEQAHIAELISIGQLGQAQRLLNEKIMPNRLQLVRELTSVFDSQRTYVEQALKTTAAETQHAYTLISSLGSVALLLGIFTIFVVRRLGKTELELIDQGDRVRALYEVSAISGLSIDEQIHETLKLGCRILELEIGKVCKIDERKQSNTFINTVAPAGYSITNGAVLPLDKTFCSLTYQSDAPIMVNNVKDSNYSNYPCYEFSHLEAYIA